MIGGELDPHLSQNLSIEFPEDRRLNLIQTLAPGGAISSRAKQAELNDLKSENSQVRVRV